MTGMAPAGSPEHNGGGAKKKVTMSDQIKPKCHLCGKEAAYHFKKMADAGTHFCIVDLCWECLQIIRNCGRTSTAVMQTDIAKLAGDFVNLRCLQSELVNILTQNLQTTKTTLECLEKLAKECGQ